MKKAGVVIASGSHPIESTPRKGRCSRSTKPVQFCLPGDHNTVRLKLYNMGKIEFPYPPPRCGAEPRVSEDEITRRKHSRTTCQGIIVKDHANLDSHIRVQPGAQWCFSLQSIIYPLVVYIPCHPTYVLQVVAPICPVLLRQSPHKNGKVRKVLPLTTGSQCQESRLHPHYAFIRLLS